MKKYTWNYSEHDELWSHDDFDTIEDCIADAKENYKIEVGESIAIGETDEFRISVDATSVLDAIEEQAYDECGEASENWDSYDYKNDKDGLDELSNQLTKCVEEWLKQRNNMPTFYRILNIKTIEVS